ncbi:hypothetical protein [uncultured Ruminococcus sp.]|uniref:hypothetical protein n=1 Tax=uncultured Ruminococcus sp. TaxID=165186 RepID=UPI0025F64FC0|nr:hypothetical protein [uncultured Ruminococcus sp.]
MSINNIFIATPIAGFLNKNDYKMYKKLIEEIVVEINRTNIFGNVYCEITNLDDIADYDSPAASAAKDFNNVLNSEYFILLYPQRVVSSALIELGYALAKGKKILIISSDKNALPYMALELDKIYHNVTIKYSKFTFHNLFDYIKAFCCK